MNKIKKAIIKSRDSYKEELSELLILEKERDEVFTVASSRHKYHPTEETLAKMKSLECANNAYRSGIRQGKIEIIQRITTSQKDIFTVLIEAFEELKKKQATEEEIIKSKDIGKTMAEDTQVIGFNQAISKTQDIIRKAREV